MMRGRILPFALVALVAGGVLGGIYFTNKTGFGEEGDAENRAINWADEEILSQLTELRQEVAVLRKEVGALRKEGADKPDQPRRGAPELSSMKLPDGPSLGDSDAKIAIVEYADFQCPYCARHHRDVFPEIKQEFIEQGKLRYWAEDFPLSFHSKAEGAAVAARCAGRQGKYWAMHHKLFENARSLGDDLYQQIASELSLDQRKFGDCMQDKDMKAKVMASMVDAQKLGVTGTPRFFVGRIENGSLTDVRAISGAQSFPVFEHHINELLKADG